jgi:hypothetical protein
MISGVASMVALYTLCPDFHPNFFRSGGDSTWSSQKTALALAATERRKIVAHGETVCLVAK